jgi:hypothetical protein
VAILEVRGDIMDINLTGQILGMPIYLTGQTTSPSPLWDSQIIGVIVGGLIASITSYFLDIKKEQQEYHKDLADALIKAYSDVLSTFFKGPETLGIDAVDYLRKLAETLAPLEILGSDTVQKLCNNIYLRHVKILASEMSDNEKTTALENLGKKEGVDLIDQMKKDIRERPDYMKTKHWWQRFN